MWLAHSSKPSSYQADTGGEGRLSNIKIRNIFYGDLKDKWKTQPQVKQLKKWDRQSLSLPGFQDASVQQFARSHGSRNQVKCRYQKDRVQLCLPWSGSMPPRLRSSSSDSEFFKGSLNILPCARYSSSSEWSSSTWSCKSWSLKTNTSLTWDTKSSSNKKNR